MARWVSVDAALSDHRAQLDEMAVRLGRRVDARNTWRRPQPPKPMRRCRLGHLLPARGSCRRCPTTTTTRTVGLGLVLVLSPEVEARRAKWRQAKRDQRAAMTPAELEDWRRFRAMDLRAWRARKRREAAAS